MKTLNIQFFQADMSKKGISSCSSCDTIQQKLDQAIQPLSLYWQAWILRSKKKSSQYGQKKKQEHIKS